MAKEGYQKVANKKDLPEGGLFKVEPQDRHIVLSMVNGKVYAMDAVCSHEGGPLEEGSLDGYNLTCPWHYAIFDVRNAKVSDQTAWATDLDSYQAEVDEESGDIYVNLEAGEKDKDKISAISQRRSTRDYTTATRAKKARRYRQTFPFQL
jgi:nitrite reductase/ring-hydroxylating ferredoxin subunit